MHRPATPVAPRPAPKHPPRTHPPQPCHRGNALAVIAATALFLLLVLSLLAAAQ